MKFQLLIKTKVVLKIKTVLSFKLSDVVLIMLINIKVVPTFAGIFGIHEHDKCHTLLS